MLAWLFSDYFERMPGLKIALSEGNIGWMPYFIERAEQVIDKQRHWAKATNTAFYNNEVATEAGDGEPRHPRRAGDDSATTSSAASSRRARGCGASTSSARTT